MSDHIEGIRMQPENIVSDSDGSISGFLEDEPRGSTFREKIRPENPSTIKRTQDYFESENPREQDPEFGPKVLESALEKSSNIEYGFEGVTSYELRIFDEFENELKIGVEYYVGNTTEPEAKSSSSPTSV